MMAQETEIDALLSRIKELEAENARLKEIALNRSGLLARHFKLMPQQAHILECLARSDGNAVKTKTIYEFLGSKNADYRRIVKVQMHGLRRKILPFEILSAKGQGYSLLEPGLSQVRAVMEGQNGEAI